MKDLSENKSTDKQVSEQTNNFQSRLFWDINGNHLDDFEVGAIRKRDIEIADKFKKLIKYPHLIKIIVIILVVFVLANWANFIYIGINPLVDPDTIFLYTITALPILLYFFGIKRIEEQSADSLIASEFNWIYDPKPNTFKWFQVSIRFPEIFRKGIRNLTIGSQFWGTFGPDKISFWMCDLGTPKNDSGEGMGRVTDTVIALKLHKITTADFFLKPQHKALKAKHLFSKPLTTESIDFNKRFHIEFKGNLMEKGADIFQVLAPNAQEKIIKFHDESGRFKLLFRDNVMIVSFPGNFELKHTSFFRKVELDPRDVEALRNGINSILKLANDILPDID